MIEHAGKSSQERRRVVMKDRVRLRKRLAGSFAVMFFFLMWGTNSARAEYPEKSIRLIATFAPGGSADLIGRALAQYANPYLKGKAYVENVSGAAGAIGFRAGAKADPDGYTVTVIVTSNIVGPHVVKDYPSYELFDIICTVGQTPFSIVVRTDSPFKAPSDLISYAKANPGKVTGCTPGVGSANHLGIAALENAAGIKFTLVPYKGGGPCMTAVVGGHLDVACHGSEAAPLLEGKKLRPLIVLGLKRFGNFPNVPTAKEAGYDAVVYQLTGLGVPKGTPGNVQRVLTEAFRKAVENENFQKFMDKMGIEGSFLGPQEASQFLKTQSDLFKNVAISIGLKPQ